MCSLWDMRQVHCGMCETDFCGVFWDMRLVYFGIGETTLLQIFWSVAAPPATTQEHVLRVPTSSPVPVHRGFKASPATRVSSS